VFTQKGNDMSIQYDHSLAAALAVMEQLDGKHDIPKHVLCSILVYAFLYALESYDKERGSESPQFSTN
jgi:hypothetical protein